MRGTSRTLLTVVFLTALAGCSDDKTTNPLPGPKYTASSTPQQTLANLVKAYSTRDSTGYDSLFDATYAGTSFDPNTMAAINLTKTDEAMHISALARTSGVTASVQFPPTLVRERDGADPPGWAMIRLQNALVAISDNQSATVYFISPTLTQEFKFAPTTPSVGSPTDTTWHIVRWTEF